MSEELMAYFDKKFDTMQASLETDAQAMETRLRTDAQTKHLEVMQYLQQLILEQFKTRMEVTQLTQRVAALEGKKPNGHAAI